MLKFGFITELNSKEGTARVNFTDEGIVSNLLPISVQNSKADKYSFPFAINEHVWCLMDDNCEFGVIGGAIYSKKDSPVDGSSDSKTSIQINNKLKIEVDRNSGKLEVSNDGVSLLDLFVDLKAIISELKVFTPSGPSTSVLPKTVQSLSVLENKYKKLLK